MDSTIIENELWISIPRNVSIVIQVHGDITIRDLPQVTNQLARWLEGFSDALHYGANEHEYKTKERRD